MKTVMGYLGLAMAVALAAGCGEHTAPAGMPAAGPATVPEQRVSAAPQMQAPDDDRRARVEALEQANAALREEVRQLSRDAALYRIDVVKAHPELVQDLVFLNAELARVTGVVAENEKLRTANETLNALQERNRDLELENKDLKSRAAKSERELKKVSKQLEDLVARNAEMARTLQTRGAVQDGNE